KMPLRKCHVIVLKTTCSWMCVATVGFLLFLAVCLLYLPDSVSQSFASTAEKSSEVTLLIWTHPFSRYRRLPDCQALYQVSGCTLTDDWRAYPHADAVIIHHREIATNVSELPPEPRPRLQKWIWMNFESPTHSRGLWRFEGVFNLTMTYRTDSDIFGPKPRLVVWVISNWSESHARVLLYHQLSRYVQVDVFGRAGRPIPGDSGSDSLVRLVSKYQFYLALENSQHTDYITEKLWNAVLAGAVPVVLGPSRDNYERFLPPEAFIHVDDFATVRELAQYLLLLRRSPARLQRHLDWRRSYRVHQPSFWAEHYCTACVAVKNAKGRTDVVTDIANWFQS
uniref:Fucosyltransferase n=1 Tax=Myripristis murdjan TaxID=586833 RepID=A0A667XNA6_9TELE